MRTYHNRKTALILSPFKPQVDARNAMREIQKLEAENRMVVSRLSNANVFIKNTQMLVYRTTETIIARKMDSNEALLIPRSSHSGQIKLIEF